MGNRFSRTPTGESETHFISEIEAMAETNTSEHEQTSEICEDQFYDTSDEPQTRARDQEMEEFKKDLAKKREQRREILIRHREEKDNLSKSLNIERKEKIQIMEENKALKELLKQNNIEYPESLRSEIDEDTDIMFTVTQLQNELETLKENNKRLRKDLAGSNFSLQAANADIATLNFQNIESIKQIKALKEVVTVSKTMIGLREQQLNELKEKLSQIEQSLADRETNLLSTDLKQEYEKQLQNIRTLRGLYEERARLAEVTRLNLLRDLEEEKRSHLGEVNKCIELTGKVEELEAKVSALSESLENKIDEIKTTQEETKGLKAEMLTVNKLFSQVLLGYKSKQNWDQLVVRLEENHGILSHMVEQDDGFESSSALPKLLLELVNQVDDNDIKCSYEETKKLDIPEHDASEESKDESEIENSGDSPKASAEEIVENLPKVWKVLLELLSHQNPNDTNSLEKITTCYKTVETASGSVLVPSVSQTYIRLKDLIIEKLALIKEVNKMKQLNTHLESRLGEQERRLCLVTSELSKTWHVVGRLRRHHHQLHTHEKILKYELQQKRKLLTELKEELEYCREKWETAREKNSQSERDWKKLRAEFSSRKTKVNSPLFNNSGESGYSDERPSDDSSESNDDSECVSATPLRPKKKIKKSFDNILDSSADFNLTAEREDPISDMIDVAELPLDSHELEEIAERPGTSSGQTEDSCSESCNLLKSDKTCDETEDELGDIAMEPSSEENTSDDLVNNVTNENTIKNIDDLPTTSNNENHISRENNSLHTQAQIIEINPADILANIRKQNEMLAEKDKRLGSLEKNSLALLRQSQNTISKGEQLNETLDHILSRPSTSSDANVVPTEKKTENDSFAITTNDENNISKPNNSLNTSAQIININAAEILANIRKQNEMLAEKDKRLGSLEKNSLVLLQKTQITISKGEQLNETLDHILSRPGISSDENAIPLQCNENIPDNTIDSEETQKKNSNENEILTKDCTSNKNDTEPDLKSLEQNCTLKEVLNNNSVNNNEESMKSSDKTDSDMPSTSKSDIDHEAIFAARDIRLKRLEEQTKSLVSKVNDTTTKGVKIHYKLEELHNIYGSENSRAGTPSADNEDDEDENNDDKNTNKEN